MPMATQIKLLRVLESGEITRVGSNQPVRVNVRILSATNRNLEDAVEDGGFRSDLYHRLKVVTILIPSLQERSADIPLLIEHFMKQFARRHQKPIKSMSRAARVKLLAFSWPGNVRQLRNVIESMVVVDCDETLDVDDLPAELEPEPGEHRQLSKMTLTRMLVLHLLSDGLLVNRKDIYWRDAQAGWRKPQQTAEMLGIGERTLYRKIKEYKLH